MQVDLKKAKDIASEIASKLKKGDIITLTGDLGAGKTTFSKFLINSYLGDDIDVTSPTFNIVQIYESDINIWHYDLYRLEEKEEIFELGIEDAFENITIIEWPEIISDFLPPALNISITGINERKYQFTFGKEWKSRLSFLNE